MNQQEALTNLQDSAAAAGFGGWAVGLFIFLLFILVCMAASHDEHEQAMAAPSPAAMLPHTVGFVTWSILAIVGCGLFLAVFAPLDRLDRNADYNQPATVQRAYPSPTPHNTLNQMSPGDKLREEARQFREQQRQNRQPSGQSSSFPFPFSGK